MPSAQHLVDFLDAGGVAAHELFEVGRLVVPVVIDVHPRVLRALFVDEVHHGLEGLLLFGLRHRPPFAIDGLVRGVERDDAKEILAPAFGRERVAL